MEVVVVGAKRTAIGSFLGSLKDTKAVDLATACAKSISAQIGGGGEQPPNS